MVKLRETYFDERNGRYLTPDGVCCNPRCYSCIEEEINEDGDFELTNRGRVLMMDYELNDMIKVEGRW